MSNNSSPDKQLETLMSDYPEKQTENLKNQKVITKPDFRRDVVARFATLDLLAKTFCLSAPCSPVVCWSFSNNAKSWDLELSDKALIFRYKTYCMCCQCNNTEQIIPLDKITDIKLNQSWIMACFGIHGIVIQTANSGGPGSEISLLAVEDPIAFRSDVMHARDQAIGMANPSHIANQPLSMSTIQDDRVEHLAKSVDRIEATLLQIAKNTAK